MIPIPAIKRYPSYLRILEEEKERGTEYISTTTLAEALGLKPIQVRKDISATGISGKPKVGFEINELCYYLTRALGWDGNNTAIIIGAGNLGCALCGYDGFKDYGLSIVGIFDNSPEKIGTKVKNFTVMDVRVAKDFIRNNHIGIGVITVPAEKSQGIADFLVSCGIKGIWNFAPKDLKVPDDVVLQRTDLATSLAVLSAKLRNNAGKSLQEVYI